MFELTWKFHAWRARRPVKCISAFSFSCAVLGSWTCWWMKGLDETLSFYFGVVASGCCERKNPPQKIIKNPMKAWKLESSPVRIKVNMRQVPVEHLICYVICLRFQCPFQENLFFLLRVSDLTIWKKHSRCRGKWPCSSHIILSNLATMIHMFLMDLFNGTLFDNPIVAAGTDLHHGMALFGLLSTKKPTCFGSLYSQK